MRSDHASAQVALLDTLNDRRARDAKQIRGLFRRNFGIVGKQGDLPASFDETCQVFDDIHQPVWHHDCRFSAEDGFKHELDLPDSPAASLGEKI